MIATELSMFPAVCPDRLMTGSDAEPDPAAPPNKRISITITFDGIFTVDEVWPDGDWPSEITEQAVEHLVEDGGPLDFIDAWGLSDHEIAVSVVDA